MGGQDRMEGNIVSLSQHDYYGSLLQDYTCMTYIELFAFSVGIGGRKGEKLELKVLEVNTKNGFCMQLGNTDNGV